MPVLKRSAPDSPGLPGSVELSYRRYRDALRSFFRRRSRKSTNADDLVQEVYEKLLRYPSQTPIQNPEAYVFQVAWNVLRSANQQASTENRRYVTAGPEELEGYAAGVGRLWIQEDGGHEIAEEEFERVLNQLPRVCRVALLRQRRDGWSHQQIAEELGVSINSVKSYLGKAFNHFRIHFSLHSPDP